MTSHPHRAPGIFRPAAIVAVICCAVSGTAHAEEYVYQSQWGSHGQADGQFNIIGGIAVAGTSVYVTDTVDMLNYRIQVFDAAGNHLQTYANWSDYRSATGGIAVDGAGQMYTSVVGTFHIAAATPQMVIITKDDFNPPRDSFRPSDVALDTQGSIYVAECVTHQVNKFNALGQFVSTWGSQGSGEGQFQFVGGIAVGPDDSVYVTDKLGDRVQRLTGDGQFLGAWGSRGTGEGEFMTPRGLDVDADGNVYVADWLNHRVQKFDATGVFITAWGSRGGGDGQFEGPVDVAVAPDGSTVYVADLLNYRVQVFQRQ